MSGATRNKDGRVGPVVEYQIGYYLLILMPNHTLHGLDFDAGPKSEGSDATASLAPPIGDAPNRMLKPGSGGTIQIWNE